MNIHEKINYRDAIDKWRSNTNKAILRSIQTRGLVHSGQMKKEVKSRTIITGGKVQKVQFTVNLYAIFLDMAVSKGHGFGARAQFFDNRQTERLLGQRFTRQPKLYRNIHWLNKVFYGRTMDLARMNVNMRAKELESIRLPQRIEINL